MAPSAVTQAPGAHDIRVKPEPEDVFPESEYTSTSTTAEHQKVSNTTLTVKPVLRGHLNI